MGKNLDGENLANFLSVINFTKFLHYQSFPPFGKYLLIPASVTCAYTRVPNVNIFTYIYL